MQVETFFYNDDKGWSVPQFPALDSEHTLLIIFASEKFGNNSLPYEQLKEFYKKSIHIGCSTAGEILQKFIYDQSLVVSVIKLENTRIKAATAIVNKPEESYSAGELITQQLLGEKLSHIFLLSDGLNVNGTDLINGIRASAPQNVTVTGGLAGDGSRFQHTWTLSQKKGIASRQVVAIGFYGDQLKVAYGSQGGWDTFGPERVITKSNKNVVYEIDGQPALKLYKQYLGEQQKNLPASALLYPMAIRPATNGNTTSVVRTILAIDEETQSLTFAGNMPEHWYAKLMTANFDRLVDGAASAASLLENNTVNGPLLVIAISCVGRRLVLGERAEEEIEAVLEKLPAHTQLIGFYSYGEISPSGLTKCDLHNQTMTLTTFTESV